MFNEALFGIYFAFCALNNNNIENSKLISNKPLDFEDIRNSDDFHSWAKEQPDSIQKWIYSNADDADLASRALDLFKRDIGMDVPK